MDLEAEASLSQCGALKDFWYVACLSSELSAKKPLARRILDTGLVLFRDPSGQPAALRDRCLHRNARLSRGVILDGRLGCPYHGWVYDASGTVVEVPSLGRALKPCEQGQLQRFDTLEQDGLVYVFMGGNSSRARSPAFSVPHWKEPGWTSYFLLTHFENGVTNLVENFMDVPHTVFVHPGWFRKAARKRVPATVERKQGSVLVTYRQEADSLTGLGRIFNPGGKPLVHTDHFFVPNVTRVDYLWGDSGFVINSQCTPVRSMESVVYTAISYKLPRDLPGQVLGRAIEPVIRWYTRQVIEQDVRIMAIQKEGLLDGPGGGVFRSTEADLLHTDIEAYRDWLLAGGEGAGPEDACRDIVFWI